MFPGRLRVYREIVRHGSIHKAGNALALAPSSVSRQLAILKRQVRARLLNGTLRNRSVVSSRILDRAHLVQAGCTLGKPPTRLLWLREARSLDNGHRRAPRRPRRLIARRTMPSATSGRPTSPPGSARNDRGALPPRSARLPLQSFFPHPDLLALAHPIARNATWSRAVNLFPFCLLPCRSRRLPRILGRDHCLARVAVRHEIEGAGCEKSTEATGRAQPHSGGGRPAGAPQP